MLFLTFKFIPKCFPSQHTLSTILPPGIICLWIKQLHLQP